MEVIIIITNNFAIMNASFIACTDLLSLPHPRIGKGKENSIYIFTSIYIKTKLSFDF